MENCTFRHRVNCSVTNTQLEPPFTGIFDRRSSKEKETPRKELSSDTSNPRTLSMSSSTTDSEAEDSNGKSNGRQLRRFLSAHRPKAKLEIQRCNSVPDMSRLEMFLAESRHIVSSVKHVIVAGWELVSHHSLPEWLKDNEYLLRGHRPILNSFRACFRSVFRIHTETGNIWTHLLGMIAFISIAAYTLSSRSINWMWQDITVHSVYFGGAILCLTFSWLFHALYCHSEKVNSIFSKLDYCGIALLTVGSFVPWLYYSFFCHPVAHIVYLVSISVLGSSCIIVSLFDKFATPAYRPLRAGCFIALGLTGVVPAIHFVTIEGLYSAVFQYGFLHLIAMAFLYIGGALMYAFRIPESIYPGKFDIWFQSHQIFHICVIVAALVHFRGIQIISHARLNFTECCV